VRIGEGDQRGHSRPSRLDVPGKVKLQQTLQDVFDKVRSNHCREIPVQLRQEEKLPFQDVFEGDIVVGELDKFLSRDGGVGSHLPADKETDRGQQLQLRPSDIANCQEPVKVVDGEAKHLRVDPLLLTQSQHPTGDLLSHARLNLCLNRTVEGFG